MCKALYAFEILIIDREAIEIIRLVASVCPSVTICHQRRLMKHKSINIYTKLKLARTKPTHQKLARTKPTHERFNTLCACWASCVEKTLSTHERNNNAIRIAGIN